MKSQFQLLTALCLMAAVLAAVLYAMNQPCQPSETVPKYLLDDGGMVSFETDHLSFHCNPDYFTPEEIDMYMDSMNMMWTIIDARIYARTKPAVVPSIRIGMHHLFGYQVELPDCAPEEWQDMEWEGSNLDSLAEQVLCLPWENLIAEHNINVE